MASQLFNIVQFSGLVVGVPLALPHGLNIDGRGVLPELVIPDTGDYIITVDTVNVTVERGAGAAANVFVWLWHYHSILRNFGPFSAFQPTYLTPPTLILQPGTVANPLCDVPPANVNTLVGSAGSSAAVSRCDHKHNVDVAAPTIGIGGGNAAGNAITLALSDHDHLIHETGGPTDLTVGAIAVGDAIVRVGATLVGSAVAAGGSPTFIWGASDINSAADTRYIALGSGVAASLNVDFTFIATRAGTLRNMYVRHNTAVGNGQNAVYALLLNGVATSLTVTIATGAIATASDLVNTVTIAQGDRIDMRCIKAVNIGAGNVNAQISVELY